MKTKKQQPTLRQKLVIDSLSANVGVPGRLKTKAAIIRAAGYSEAVARNPDHVFDAPIIQSAVAKVIKKMEYKRDMALDAITGDKFIKSSALSDAMTMDLLTKNIELLSGRPTARDENLNSDEEIFERILERSSGGRVRETKRITRRRTKKLN